MILNLIYVNGQVGLLLKSCYFQLILFFIIEAQFHEFVSDTNGQILNVTTVKSNYECYNLCIRNPICATATMLSRKGFNCFLKSKYDSYRNPPIDSEIIRISEYKNEVRLNFLPYNQVYKFRVAVYDQISNQWSEFSDPSTELLTKIGNLENLINEPNNF